MTSFEKASQWQRGLFLLDEVDTRKVQANAVVLNAAISACGNAGKWEVAVHLLHHARARTVRPDLVTYDAAISACANGMDWQRAICLLTELQKTAAQLVPPESP